MSLDVKIAFEGNLAEVAEQTHLRLARGARNATEKQAARAKLALRQDTRSALGDKVANAWRADIFPRSASTHTHAPAVFVHSNAPDIVRAFSEATLIVAKNGTYLAVPTANVPRRGNRRATPAEVKAIYGIESFALKKTHNGNLLGFVPAVRSRNGVRWRRASSIRTGRQRRSAKLVLMFVFVRQVGLRKLLNWPKIFQDLQRSWAELFPAEIAAALAAGSN